VAEVNLERLFMAIKKYLDWRKWLDGFYTSWIKTLTGTLMALGGTNVAEAMGWQGIGINLQQAGGVFLSVTFWEVVRFFNTTPKPPVTEVSIDTQLITKPKDQ
jgi:hypothetical protein